MRLEELMCLVAEAFFVMSGAESRQIDFSLLANQVRKVRVNALTLRLLDELDKTSEVLADIFQHRGRNILPELIGLHFDDQFQLCPNHRDTGLFLQRASDLANLLTPSGKRPFVPQ